MKHLKIILLLITTVILTNCQKEDPIISDEPSEDGVESFFVIPQETIGNSKLEGIVSDNEGNPLANVTVQYGNETVQTNNSGYYYLNKLSDGENKPIYFLKDGYMMTQKLASIDKDRVSRIDASLYQIEVDAEVTSEGETLTYDDFEISIPEGAYTEKVNVRATAYRVSDDNFNEAFPGNFEGEREDNSVVPIESLGFINVEVSNDKGFVDPKLPVTLKIKAPEDSPNSIPMWYFDFAKKKWVEEGSWNLVDGYFVGEVNHFTPWNVDIPRDPPRSEIFGRVIDQTGSPLENALVKFSGENRNISNQVYTDENGEFSLLTLSNTDFLIEATWSFYYPTLITKASSGEANSQVDAGDIIINVSDENEADPIITDELVKMIPGENIIIKGNFFGNEFRTNYKVLIDDNPVDIVKNWSNTEIQFTAPSWINNSGTISVLRGNKESNGVDYEYPDEMWTNYGQNLGGINTDEIPSITENTAGDILIGTHQTGVIIFSDGEFQQMAMIGSQFNKVEDVFVDSKGVYWIGSTEGLFSIENGNLKNWNFNDLTFPLNCYSITEDDSGVIWVASLRDGLIKIDGDEVDYFRVTNSLIPTNALRSVYYSENTKSLWIGTMDLGLIEFDGTSFNNWNTSNSNLQDNTIYNIVEEDSGELWLGTKNSGLVKYFNNNFQSWNTNNSEIPSNDVYRLDISSNGDLWVGTWNGGLVRFDKENNFEIWNTNNSDILDNRISEVFEASDGSVWVGLYQRGISKLNFRKPNG